MANYTGIQGQNILIVSSDPSNPTEGQIWYNSTSNLLKGSQNVVVAAAWASGGNLATARRTLAASTNGTQTANIVFGGYSTGSTGETESYNGTSWSPAPSMNTDRYYLGGAGTQTAALAFGGKNPTTGATEKWNGSTWTNNPTGLNVARHYVAGCGTQTTALAIGGNPGNPPTSAAEAFNGSTWTNLTNMTTPRSLATAFGVSTAAIAFNASSPPAESWNGSSWTAIANMNTARNGAAAAGTQTAGLAFGGIPSRNLTELWNGTAWSTQPTMTTGRHYLGGCGTQTSALGAGGDAATVNTAATEEWTGASASLQTKTITTS